MAELLVFTLLAALAAIYPILPEHRQLRVRYSFWTKSRLIFVGLMFLSIIITYWLSILIQSNEKSYVTAEIFDFSFRITLLHVESAQLIAVLLIVVPIAILFIKPNVRIRNEDNLLEILRDLYNRQEFTTLVNLLEYNYDPIINHPSKPVDPNSHRIVSYVSPEFSEIQKENKEGENVAEVNSIRNQIARDLRRTLRYFWTSLQDIILKLVDNEKKFQNRFRLIEYYLAVIRYRADNTAEDVSDYTESLLVDPEFSDLYSDLASELGLKILRDDTLQEFPRQGVVHQYLRTQLRTKNSLLYRNLEQNVEMDGLYYYNLKKENRLIYHLFSEPGRARELNIYKPIGDQTREVIREQRREEFDKYHDQRLTDTRIDDDYIFSDPIYIGIQFFDVMVREAFRQGVDSHMWLSYYESFTREICRNYEITEYSDPDAEWPNDYSRLLYEMVSNMRDWMKMLEEELKPDIETDSKELPLVLEIDTKSDGSEIESSSNDQNDVDSESNDCKQQNKDKTESVDETERRESDVKGSHIQLGSISTDRMLRNIPEMTVIVLFSCHKEILTTDEIPLQFMSYITEQIFLCLLNLREYAEGTIQWRYSEFMLKCLAENLTGRQSDSLYRENLRHVYHGNFGDAYEYGVRHEVSVKDRQMVGLVDDLDEIINT